MLDPTSVQTDRLRDSGRWGYTGEFRDDPLPIEESPGVSRPLLWIVLLAVALIVIVALVGAPL
jgi:hypothetical protein